MTKDSLQNQEDLFFIKAIANADQEALGRLYDKYAPALTGIITRILHTGNAADEILQKVFQFVWNEYILYDPSRHSVFTWLIKITRQAAIDNARSTLQMNPATTNSVHICATDKTGENNPATEMQMFDLLFYKGLTCAETARAMKLPGELIQAKLRMAVKKLAFIKAQ